MRNLKITEHRKNKVAVSSPGHICKDITGNVYFVNSKGIETLETGSDGNCESFTLAWADHDIATKEVIGADIVTASNSICVITKEGDVITVTVETCEVELCGSVSAGIEASCWSPDQELLVLITGDGNVVIMTADFEPLNEFPLNKDEFGENMFVNVGWGKKETQFHGKEGKQAAKVSKKEVKPVTEWDDLKPRISWRGDGQLFVYSYVAQGTQSRLLRTVNREGILQYTSETVDGLEHALSWKPSGSLIASSQRLPNKHSIVLFEKNGLKHEEFTLPFKPTEMIVKEVMWNQDSSTLLIWLQKCGSVEGDQNPVNTLQLWTTGNYHWYLKQELQFTEGLISVQWDAELPLLLHLLTPTHLHHYRWTVTTDISRGLGLSDLAQVAVIDGSILKITPFRQCVIPPPMSSYEARFEQQIHTVLYAPPISRKCDMSPDNSVNVEDSGFLEAIDPPGCSSNNICVVHGYNMLTFLVQAHANDNLDDFGCNVKITGSGGNGFNVRVKVHKVIAQHQIEWEADSMVESPKSCQFYNWVWAETKTLLACYMEEGKCFLAVIELHALGSEAAKVVVKNVIPVEESVVSIAPAPDGTIACLQLSSGALLELNLRSKIIEPLCINGKETAFPTVCQQMSLCPVKGEGLVPLGITSRNRLYVANEQVLANCTSYHIHTDHLLVTTTSHTLQVIPLEHTAVRKLCEGQIEDTSVSGIRKVERGSRLVTAIPLDTRIVLQMPRGNLEVISPRPLSVHILKSLLNEHKYHKAIDMMRKQRIDLNLLYDHNSQDFMNHTSLFVQNVDNPHWLDLFLANLNEFNVSKTMYSFNYSNSNTEAKESCENKINIVCEAVRKAMTEIDEERYLLPILTSYVKMNPCQMDVALRKIKEMKDSLDRQFKVSAEEGIRHLLYISDVNELFDVALGTYDFDLVMIVAEKSQKDPKEYLPFLNELKQLDENYMKFKINVHLHRFQKALECLKESSDHHEECLKLIVSEKLYKEALQIFPPSSAMNKAVCEEYGNYLMSRKYYNEAAIMYSRSGAFEEALDAYQQAGNWKMGLVMCSKLKSDREALNNFLTNQVLLLKERREFLDAAVLYEEYLKNEEEAVDCLVKACQWEDAIRMSYKHNREDLIDTNVLPGILDHYEFSIGEIDRFYDNFSDFILRLTEVRKIKEKQHLEFLEGKDDGQLDSDLYSDTSTVTGFSYSRSHTSSSRGGSSVSGRTYRSTKNKRKLERKKHSTKEGSAFEDLGLVTALHEIIGQTDKMTAQITSLSTILATFNMDDKASHLQSSFVKLLSLQTKHEKEIWPAHVVSEENDVEFGPQLTTEGAVNLLKGNGSDCSTSIVAQRMKNLDPHLQHAPVPSRSQNWELHMFMKNKSTQ